MVRLLSLCQQLFEFASGFPRSGLLSVARWEIFTEDSGLQKIIARVRVPCLTVGPPKKEFRSNGGAGTNWPIRNLGTNEDSNSGQTNSKLRRHTESAKSNHSTTQFRSNKLKDSSSKINDSLSMFGTQQREWLFDLPSNYHMSRSLSWSDLRWLYFKPLHPIGNQQRHNTDINKNGGIGFWNFWELLVGFAYMHECMNACDNEENLYYISLNFSSASDKCTPSHWNHY